MRLAASLNHPSLIGADFFGMPVKAFDTPLVGIGTKGVMKADGGGGTCVCGSDLVSLARKVAATVGSYSVPDIRWNFLKFKKLPGNEPFGKFSLLCNNAGKRTRLIL